MLSLVLNRWMSSYPSIDTPPKFLTVQVLSMSRLGERQPAIGSTNDEPEGCHPLQREVHEPKASPTGRLLGPLQLRADEHGGEVLGERDLHDSRGLHVPGQSGTAARAMEGADIDCDARPWHRLRGDAGRHQVLEKLWQYAHLAAGHLPRLL